MVANSNTPQSVPTSTVELTCADKSVVIQVAIITCVKDCLLGQDVMYHFGIKVDGIPAEFTSVAQNPGEERGQSSISATEARIQSVEEIQVLNGVQNILESNQRLDRSRLCTLDYAEVSLETGDSVPVNRRQ